MNSAAPETKTLQHMHRPVRICPRSVDQCDTEVKRSSVPRRAHLAVLGPLVLAADLLLLLGGEVVLDVERLADLVGGLALDHVGDGLAADVQESLDVEVVGGEDDLEEHLLVDLHELLVPLVDVGRLLARVGVVVLGGGRVVLVVAAPLDDLLHDCLVDLRHVSGCSEGRWEGEYIR